MPTLYATVRWVLGEDKGKITVGVPTDYIMNFNHQEFLSQNFDPDESYVIEWRKPGKKPAGGWPKYEGVILDVAPTIRALEKKSQNYFYQKSPRLISPAMKTTLHAEDGPLSQPSGSGGKRTSDTPVDAARTKKSRKIPEEKGDDLSATDDGSSIDDGEEPLGDNTPINYHRKVTKRRRGIQINDDDEIVSGIDAGIPADRPAMDGSEGRKAPVPNGDELRNVNDPILPVNHRIPDNVQVEERRREGAAHIADGVRIDGFNANDLLNLRDLLQENLRYHQRQPLQKENLDLVELGQRGSGVTLPRNQWDAAKEQRTFTAMATSLVTSLFDPNVLLVSNVKGGKNKIRRPEENAPRHQALDPRILEAITVSVRKEFPNVFKTTDMHRAINVKLNTMRRQARGLAEANAAAAEADREQ